MYQEKIARSSQKNYFEFVERDKQGLPKQREQIWLSHTIATGRLWMWLLSWRTITELDNVISRGVFGPTGQTEHRDIEVDKQRILEHV